MMSVFVVPVDVSDENEKQEAEVTNQEIVLGRSFLVFSVWSSGLILCKQN